MKKLKLIFSVLILIVMGIGQVQATDVTFTAGTDTGDTSVEKDGITVSMSTMSRTDNYRCYANSDMTVSAASGKTITKIVVTCTANGTSNYGPGKFSGNGYTAGTAKTGTWEGSSSSVSLSASAQVRITSIVVTYTSSGGTTKPTVFLTPFFGAFWVILDYRIQNHGIYTISIYRYG